MIGLGNKFAKNNEIIVEEISNEGISFNNYWFCKNLFGQIVFKWMINRSIYTRNFANVIIYKYTMLHKQLPQFVNRQLFQVQEF